MLLKLVSFCLVGISPVGGMVAAIPLGLLVLGLPLWLVLALGVVLAYLQVMAVDVLWDALERLGWWRRALQRTRSPRLERLLASPGAFWPTVVLVPLVGSWAVMGLMRYAGVPQRRVALPILLSLVLLAAGLCAGCLWVPHWFAPSAAMASAEAAASGPGLAPGTFPAPLAP